MLVVVLLSKTLWMEKKKGPTSLQTVLEPHTYFSDLLPLIPVALLQLAIDKSR